MIIGSELAPSQLMILPINTMFLSSLNPNDGNSPTVREMKDFFLTVEPDLPIIITFLMADHSNSWIISSGPNHKFHTTFRFTSDIYMYHWRIQSFSHSWTLELYAKRVYKMEKQINKHAFFFLHTHSQLILVCVLGGHYFTLLFATIWTDSRLTQS